MVSYLKHINCYYKLLHIKELVGNIHVIDMWFSLDNSCVFHENILGETLAGYQQCHVLTLQQTLSHCDFLLIN